MESKREDAAEGVGDCCFSSSIGARCWSHCAPFTARRCSILCCTIRRAEASPIAAACLPPAARRGRGEGCASGKGGVRGSHARNAAADADAAVTAAFDAVGRSRSHSASSSCCAAGSCDWSSRASRRARCCWLEESGRAAALCACVALVIARATPPRCDGSRALYVLERALSGRRLKPPMNTPLPPPPVRADAGAEGGTGMSGGGGSGERVPASAP